MSDIVTLVHPELPGEEYVTTAAQAMPLRAVGWVDAPPPPKLAKTRKASAGDRPDQDPPAEVPSATKES